ncbi:MAG: hypothetical protein PHD95_06515 [Candidatus ainarchaeum sp.]|nr:hypothetical protein [Candidatus ainarchaeum sp.]
MASKRTLEKLFSGRKPKSLWGGAGKAERAKYKSRRGQVSGGRSGLSLKRVYQELVQISKLPGPKGLAMENYYLKTFCSKGTQKMMANFFPFGEISGVQNFQTTSNRIRKTLLNYSSGNSPKLHSLLQAVEVAIKDVEGSSKKISQIALNSNIQKSDFGKAAEVRHTFENRTEFTSSCLILLKTSITNRLGELDQKQER